MSRIEVTSEVTRRLPTRAQQERLKRSPDLPEDWKLILSADFAAFSQIFPYLFLTSVGGLVEGISICVNIILIFL